MVVTQQVLVRHRETQLVDLGDESILSRRGVVAESMNKPIDEVYQRADRVR